MPEKDSQYRCVGYVDETEVGVLPSRRGQSILVRRGDAGHGSDFGHQSDFGHRGDLGHHLAGLLGCARPEVVVRGGAAFLCIPHSDPLDRQLRQVIDVLIAIRYAHPSLMQLQLELESEPVCTKGGAT